MTSYSNSTTTRLEAFGRARGLDGFGVLKSPNNSAGLYFCVRLDSRVLSRWISLGWTRQEAREAIERLASEPSATGYSYSV